MALLGVREEIAVKSSAGASRRQFVQRALQVGGLGALTLVGGGGQSPLSPPTAMARQSSALTPHTGKAAPLINSAAQSGERTFKIAYLTLGWAGIEAIDVLGLLKERGWNIEWTRVGPISGVVNAFSSGQADIIDMSAVIAAQMYEQGVSLRIFGTAVGSLGNLVVRKSAGISSVPDLKGRKLGAIAEATATQDINASVRTVYDFDLIEDTEFVQATAPPDLANLIQRGDVEAAILWEPITTQMVQSGAATVLATQQELWEEASGSQETQVHVVYMAQPQLVSEHPQLLADLNDAQREVAELWTQKDPRLVDAFVEVTTLPSDVVEMALGATTPLWGLRPETVDTFLAQMQFNREHGTILQSDVWKEPAKVKQELFHIATS
jgi:ABC-type nitrate/sulfonate/bicarbonate transport system substrate-binding protein